MNIPSLICLSMLAACGTVAQGGEAANTAPRQNVEVVPAPKPGEAHDTLRTYFFRTNPGVLVRTEGATGKVLYADPSRNIPVGSTVFIEEPPDARCGGATTILTGTKWLVLQGPVKPLEKGVYACTLDTLDCVPGGELAAYGGADMPEKWRLVRDIILHDMEEVSGKR